jgi:hypothetical protein
LFNTPILLLIFNRPDTTELVFNEIRKQKPKYLYIAADGPRKNNTTDADLCEKSIAIATNIDWDCEVKTLLREENLGCGAAPAQAITWFFENVEQGIILEDDCIPNDSFFNYCETLLDKYKESPNLMMICGTSYQPEPLNEDTYYFSKYPHAWGWATWKRGWIKYNFKIDDIDQETITSVIENTFSTNRERKLWKRNLRMIIEGLDAWDYQWMYFIWKNDGLCITPWQNMISNIGFGPRATHTFDINSDQSNMIQHEIGEIKHPDFLAVNEKADKYERYHILMETDWVYYQNKFRSVLKRLIKP